MRRNRHIRNALIVAIAMIVLFSLLGCTDSENNCLIDRLEIIDKYQQWIDQARENKDNVQIHLLIDERNDKLEDLGC